MAQSALSTTARVSRRLHFDFMSARVPANDASQGYYESSFDLRTGLEVIEESMQQLPEELKQEFKRLAAR